MLLGSECNSSRKVRIGIYLHTDIHTYISRCDICAALPDLRTTKVHRHVLHSELREQMQRAAVHMEVQPWKVRETKVPFYGCAWLIHAFAY